MASNMKDMEARLENLELGASRRGITISNFQTREKKWQKIEDLYDLFNGFMEGGVVIDDVFPIGSNVPPTLVVLFQNCDEKRWILRNKSMLKELQVENGKPCYINDYVPSATLEKRRRIQDIVKENNSKKDDNKTKVEMKYTRGGLKIQNETYCKKVNPPTPREMVDIEMEF